MALSLEKLTSGATARGLSLHASVTADRLSRVEVRLMEGHSICGQREAARCGFDWHEIWGHDAFAVPYKLGEIGAEIIAPPKTDLQLGLVILPSYRVVAHVSGAGQSVSDVDEVSETRGLVWTVLSRSEEF